MPKANPWRDEYRADEVDQSEERSFPLGVINPDTKEEEVLTLRLRPMDEFDQSKASDLSAEWTELYIDGAGEALPAKLTLPDKTVAKLSERILYNIACAVTMEVVEDEKDRSTLIWWLGIIKRFRPVWKQIQIWMVELDKKQKKRGIAGNSLGSVETTSA